MKKIVILSSSPRKGGNSETLARKFMEGALASGHQVDFISLREYDLGYCKACYACRKLGKCFQNDGMDVIGEKLLAADAIVFATPVYFYSMTGQLKVLIDRLVPYWTRIRSDIYMLLTAWDPNEQHLDSTFEAIRGCTRDCFKDCPEKGTIAVCDVNELGSIEGNPALDRAYEMGKNV